MAEEVFLTKEGKEELEKKLKYLTLTKRAEITERIKEAREHGDLSENAEYDAAKEAQGLLEMKISLLKEKILSAKIIDDSRLNTDVIQILNKVKIKNTKNGAVMTYTLVSEHEANLKEGKLAVNTPIAQALLGKKVGDVVEVTVPAGKIPFEVIEISF